METIKNYLESMFRGLPQTEKVFRAKSELLQMMEDKYTELIKQGKSENEAIGEVISDFGNLEDLADDLGIKDVLTESKYTEENRRKLSFDEIKDYIEQSKRSILMHSLGIMFCIICVVFPIFSDSLRLPAATGASLMFVSIAAGVLLMCIAHSSMEPWDYIKKEPCSIDSAATDYLKNQSRDYTSTYSVLHSVGILLCIICFIPAVIFDEFSSLEKLGGAMLFIFVGVGVLLMTYSNLVKKTYLRLLNLNSKVDFEEIKKDDTKTVSNKTARTILSVYWSVVTCIYLCISFLTFKWHLTWIIWPIAGVARSILISIYSKEE